MPKKKAAPSTTESAPKTEPAPPTGGYTVLARRYRPQRFAEVVGQETTAQALVNAIRTGRVAHAYLFTGARGVGKTSMARILAKALNCTQGPTPEPCNACDICQAIGGGDDVDVLEIDGASNRGIDEIRELRQNVNFRPSRSRNKIYIIDEVHMLTREAFNALLKTLEEPPSHVKFIFCTTEPQKIPVTILSRCQRFEFAGIPVEKIVERLRGIAAAEGVEADEPALVTVARRAGGSMRDSQSLLDQLLAFGGKTLNVATVHALLGTATDEVVLELADRLLSRDSAGVLAVVERAAGQGVQLGELVEQLLDYFRDLMVLRAAGAEAPVVSVAAAQRERVVEQSGQIELPAILAALEILAETRSRLRGSSYGRTLVEMAVVRICLLEDLSSVSELVEQLRGAEPGERAPSRSSGARAGGGPAAAASAGLSAKKNDAESVLAAGSVASVVSSSPAVQSDSTDAAPIEVPPATRATLSSVQPPGSDPSIAEDAEAILLSRIQEMWTEVCSRAKVMLGEALSKGEPIATSGPNDLVVRFPVNYNWARGYCEGPDRLTRVEAAVADVVGRPMRVRLVLGENPVTEVVNDAAEGSGRPATHRERMAEVLKDPLVRRTVELLGAHIVRVDELSSSGSVPGG